jgi:predicted DNA-binding transcriptional regulator AlpA
MSKQIRFIPLPAVIDKTGLCRTSIYTISDFPKPVKIKGAGAPVQGGSRWVEEEVVAWMLSRINARDSAGKGAA